MKLLLLSAFLLYFSSVLIAQVPTDYAFAVKAGGTGTEEGKAIATDADGNVFVAGFFKNTATFGLLTPVTSAGNHDAFLAKYDSTGNAIWVKQFGGTDNDEGLGVATDNNGNVYYCGSFGLTADAGTDTTMTSAGFFDIFLFKYDNNGNFIWARSYGASASDYGNGLDCDGSSVYMTGSFFTSAVFDSFTLTANGQADVFLAKINSNGTVVWAEKAGSTIADNGKGIAVSDDGSVFITGSFSGTATFYGSPNVTLTTTGLTDVYTAKYDGNGDVLWAKKGGGSDNEYPYAIDTDINGNSFIAGFYSSSTATFGTQMLSNSGNGDIYVIKYDASGNISWAKDIGAADYDYAYGLTVDDGANVIVTGGFGGTVMFGSTSLTSASATTEDMFITKLDNGGNYLWAIKAGAAGSNYVWGNGVAIGVDGDIFATGSFEATANFGTTTLISLGGDETYGEDVFVCKIDQAVTPILSVSENSKSGLNVYPTLVTDFFTLSGAEKITKAELISMDGKIIPLVVTSVNNNSAIMNTGGADNGIYLVRIINNGESIPAGKIIVSK